MTETTAKVCKATGRRKASIARVRLMEGEAGIRVNGVDIDQYFKRDDLRMIVRQPLEAVRLLDRYRIEINVCGGGVAGQAGAVRHGISRALVLSDESLRPVLRKGGFLTRDPREKERKKFGRKGARRSFQYTKR
ncbi:MAG: 30S ribosomal protein S9 [Candidatus Omnitrophica bacterium]|nr:30S ribosomal protein S9 [Candidatus Omnitrophota bacterium]